MKGTTVTMASGESFSTDAVIYATGWKKASSLFDENLEMELDLASISPSNTTERRQHQQKWEALEIEAEKEVYAKNPYLKEAPMPPRVPPKVTGGQFRLYHHVVPSGVADGSIVFLGAVGTPATLIYSMVISLWTAAYMFGRLENLPSKEEMEKVAAFEHKFDQIRHPGTGNEYPWVSTDWMLEWILGGRKDG
ncbi:hypothetical protein ABW20_dc0102875 [Dactylellina cionopaga]|nr:hypothetical protein ABW20_dc0102875 [Dactylellina cionopaga]